MTGAGACVKRNFIGCRGSDEVHEDVVLHDAGLQARLGDRAPGPPAEQHLTWGAVGRDCISRWSLGPRRALGLSPPSTFGGPRHGGVEGAPGGPQRRLLTPRGTGPSASCEPVGARPQHNFQALRLSQQPRRTRGGEPGGEHLLPWLSVPWAVPPRGPWSPHKPQGLPYSWAPGLHSPEVTGHWGTAQAPHPRTSYLAAEPVGGAETARTGPVAGEA